MHGENPKLRVQISLNIINFKN